MPASENASPSSVTSAVSTESIQLAAFNGTAGEQSASAKSSVPAPIPPPQSFFRTAIELIACSLSIYFCFIGYGLIQEKIYSHAYVDEQGKSEKFTHSLFLVFLQCIGNASFALLVRLFSPSTVNHVPTREYIGVSFSYIGAMFASNYALAFMSYPAQALAKSCKLIPVMLMRIVVLGKRYKLREYMQVILITGGICVFMMGDGKGGHHKGGGEKETSLVGLALCVVSLILDGYTGPTQESINHKYKPTMAQMMFYLNLWAIAMVAVALLVTQQMWTGIAFFARHPEALPWAALFSVLSAMGQAAIIFTLLHFNSLIVVTITTTRKFFTILASVLLYGHIMNKFQWMGVGLVFAGLSIDIYAKFVDRNKHKKPETKEG